MTKDGGMNQAGTRDERSCQITGRGRVWQRTLPQGTSLSQLGVIVDGALKACLLWMVCTCPLGAMRAFSNGSDHLFIHNPPRQLQPQGDPSRLTVTSIGELTGVRRRHGSREVCGAQIGFA